MVSTTTRTKSTATKSTSTTTASHRDQRTAKNDNVTTIGYRRPNREKLNHILLLRMTERTLNRKRTKYERWKLILYDKDRGAFLDRTLKQWGTDV
uniref:Uncharacterized protein n=1 Tax=Romanomermis culicivorax TaxID=13658 RepID=A0A915I9M7_ROMCU